jgi:hypothetical protein
MLVRLAISHTTGHCTIVVFLVQQYRKSLQEKSYEHKTTFHQARVQDRYCYSTDFLL